MQNVSNFSSFCTDFDCFCTSRRSGKQVFNYRFEIAIFLSLSAADEVSSHWAGGSHLEMGIL